MFIDDLFNNRAYYLNLTKRCYKRNQLKPTINVLEMFMAKFFTFFMIHNMLSLRPSPQMLPHSCPLRGLGLVDENNLCMKILHEKPRKICTETKQGVDKMMHDEFKDLQG